MLHTQLGSIDRSNFKNTENHITGNKKALNGWGKFKCHRNNLQLKHLPSINKDMRYLRMLSVWCGNFETAKNHSNCLVRECQFEDII